MLVALLGEEVSKRGTADLQGPPTSLFVYRDFLHTPASKNNAWSVAMLLLIQYYQENHV